MDGDGLKLRIDVGVGESADADELERETGRLRHELLELDVDTVERPASGEAPAGTRAVDAGLLGTLVVTTAQELVSSVIHTLVGWLGGRPDRRVRLEIDGDSIEITDPSAEDQRRLIEVFVAHHAAP